VWNHGEECKQLMSEGRYSLLAKDPPFGGAISRLYTYKLVYKLVLLSNNSEEGCQSQRTHAFWTVETVGN
jgi:hypothetical protein